MKQHYTQIAACAVLGFWCRARRSQTTMYPGYPISEPTTTTIAIFSIRAEPSNGPITVDGGKMALFGVHSVPIKTGAGAVNIKTLAFRDSSLLKIASFGNEVHLENAINGVSAQLQSSSQSAITPTYGKARITNSILTCSDGHHNTPLRNDLVLNRRNYK